MEADIVVDDESVEDVPTEDVTVENVAVDDVAIEDAVVEDAAVEDVENIANASALNNTQPQLNVEENSDSKQVDDEIRPFADEQNQQNEPSKEDDKVTKVMEIFTDAPQNSGDGGNLNVEMSKHTENHTNPGHSNINIKKRRNVHILIFDKREILPRKSKTKAYEYLKNIARGFSAAANAGDRRRMQRKRLMRNLRANKASPSRKRNDERKPPAKRIRIGVRNSGTSISSGMTDITGSSNVSSRYNDRFA